MKISEIVAGQKEYFHTGVTLDLEFRKEQLRKIQTLLRENEDLINEAIFRDFGKSPYETLITERGLVYSEISHTLKHLKKWSGIRRRNVNLVNQPGWSRIIPEPLGNTLVIGAWNYPVQLAVLPAVSAIAAGNTVVIKPGEHARHVAETLAKLLNANFPPEFLYVYTGGVPETTVLLEQHFDKIFFTGSPAVGRIVMAAAAKHLTPVTLELGGKSPAIVLEDAQIGITAKRIVWGKFLNAGQTCVAPDFLLVPRSLEEKLLTALREEISMRFPADPSDFEAYVQIISKAHYERIMRLIDNDKVVTGGEGFPGKRTIQPTILRNCHFSDPVMQEEIFGPVLPVIVYDHFDEVISELKKRPKPLALYIFGKDRIARKRIEKELSFGGGMINEVVLHFSNSMNAFGGVGESGMGSYHGKAGFDTFTHYKSMQHRPVWFEPLIKYPPYTSLKMKLMRWILR